MLVISDDKVGKIVPQEDRGLMNGPEDPGIPVDSSQVGVVGQEGAESGPEQGGGDTDEDGGNVDEDGVENKQVDDEEAVGEGGEEHAGAGPELGHQAGRHQAGQAERDVGENCAAIKHKLRVLVMPDTEALHEVRVDTEFLSILNCD